MTEEGKDLIRLEQAKNLVDWKNPPTINNFKDDYQEALTDHSKHVSNLDKWLSTLKGDLEIRIPKGRSKVQPKLVRKQAEWRYSSLEEPFLSNEKLFDVQPVTAEDTDAARQNGLVLNKQFKTDIPRVPFINKYVRKAVNTGTVVIKLSWKEEYGMVRKEREVPVYAEPEMMAVILQQAVDSGEMTIEEAQAMIDSGEQMQIDTEMVVEEVYDIIKNCPVLEIKDSRSVIIDPTCEGDINKAQFIIDKFVTDLSTLKKDGRYKNLDSIRPSDHSPDAEPDYPTETTSFTFRDKPRQKLVVYEYWGYWDIEGDGIVKPIVASYVGDTLIRLEENPYPDKKLPFVIVQYLPNEECNSVYGEPDASLLEDNQKIIGAITRGIMDLLGKSANSQQGIRRDALDTINFDKFKKGEDFVFNPVAGNPTDLFYMSKYPEIPRSALEVISLQNNEAEALTGVKAFTEGISGEALGDSVGGIRSALDATAKRELGILRRLSYGLIEIGRKIMSMNSAWLSDEEIIRITDEEFVTIRRDDLAGNFDLTLTVSTAEMDNQRAEQLSFMLQTLGNSVPFDFTKMLFEELASLWKMPKLAKLLQEYKPQPDPLAQERAMLEIELLKAQIENERAKGMENTVDVQLKEAKTITEMAKARGLHSKADTEDLKFVEQGSGITQDKELEKIRFQQSLKEANKK